MLSLSVICFIVGSALVLFNSVDFDFIAKGTDVKDKKQLTIGKVLLVLAVIFLALYFKP